MTVGGFLAKIKRCLIGWRFSKTAGRYSDSNWLQWARSCKITMIDTQLFQSDFQWQKTQKWAAWSLHCRFRSGSFDWNRTQIVPTREAEKLEVRFPFRCYYYCRQLFENCWMQQNITRSVIGVRRFKSGVYQLFPALCMQNRFAKWRANFVHKPGACILLPFSLLHVQINIWPLRTWVQPSWWLCPRPQRDRPPTFGALEPKMYRYRPLSGSAGIQHADKASTRISVSFSKFSPVVFRTRQLSSVYSTGINPNWVNWCRKMNRVIKLSIGELDPVCQGMFTRVLCVKNYWWFGVLLDVETCGGTRNSALCGCQLMINWPRVTSLE